MADNEDLTHCIVCFDEYDKDENVPRLPSFTHTLCQSCLSSIITSSTQNTFKFPECRITHEITEKGVKEFPQSKHILSHLEKLEKDKITDAHCEEHKRPLVLYCTGSKCRKALYAMCYTEDHKSHTVTDFVKEAQRC